MRGGSWERGFCLMTLDHPLSSHTGAAGRAPLTLRALPERRFLLGGGQGNLFRGFGGRGCVRGRLPSGRGDGAGWAAVLLQPRISGLCSCTCVFRNSLFVWKTANAAARCNQFCSPLQKHRGLVSLSLKECGAPGPVPSPSPSRRVTQDGSPPNLPVPGGAQRAHPALSPAPGWGRDGRAPRPRGWGRVARGSS